MMPRIGLPCVSGWPCQRLQQLSMTTLGSWMLGVSMATLVLCCMLLITQAIASLGTYQGVWTVGGARLKSEGLGYAVVVDAGSSGSRAHIYVWPPHTGNRSDLLSIQPLRDHAKQPLVEAITPGLSSMRETPYSVGRYLRPLLDFAAKHIPRDKHRETPIYIMATAGMRMLAKEEQAAIISQLRLHIQQNYNFLLAENNIQVITGREEGIYQWIAINFALGRFRHAHNGPMVRVETVAEQPITRLKTVGALDMGGASMQIGFEVTTKEQQKLLLILFGDVPLDSHVQFGPDPVADHLWPHSVTVSGDVACQGWSHGPQLASTHLDGHRSSIAVINLGCADHDREHTYRVYVTTFLGYGANEAYRRHSAALRARYTNTTRKLYDPCLVRDYSDKPVLRNSTACREQHPSPANCTIPVLGTGDWHQCEQMVRKQILDERQTRLCPDGAEGCSRTLVAPPVNLADTELYGFSELWYSMEDTLRSGGQYSYGRFSQTAKDYCVTGWPTILRRRRQGLYGISDDERLSRQCFKSVYLTAALHDGLGLPHTYGGLITAPSMVAGRVCTWTLGALLYKLRFLPVRSVEAATFSHFSVGSTSVLGSQYLLLCCVLVVLGVLGLYVLRLRRLRRARPRVRLLSEHEPMMAVRVS